MISFPVEMLFQRIIHTLERDIIPLLGSSFSKAQATGIVSLLTNIAPRLEQRCDLLKEEIEENRAILREVLGTIVEQKTILRLSPYESKTITKLEDMLIKVSSTDSRVLTDENKRLLQILVDTIRELNSLETLLPPAVYIGLKDKIRGHLRRQLEREMAFLASTKFGRMSSI